MLQIENATLEAKKMESQIYCHLFENCSDNSLSHVSQNCKTVLQCIYTFNLKFNMLDFFKQ